MALDDDFFVLNFARYNSAATCQFFRVQSDFKHVFSVGDHVRFSNRTE